MQFTSFLLLITVSLLTLTAAWTKEDHEIFRVRDELTALEGADVSFYDFLGVVPTATYEEIKKQTKKRSRVLHPDRAVNSMLAERQKSAKKEMNKKAGVTVTKGPTAKERTKVTKEANDRYALLAVVVEILRGSSRDRYDHFLRNGFPVWKGTGYFYQRFRPGLGSVLVGLFIMFGGAAHYGAMIIGYRRQREFVERYVSHARSAAWGSENGIPGVPGSTGTATPPQLPVQDEDEMGAMPMNRRQKRMQEKEGKRKDSPRLARSARMNGTSSPIVAEQTSGPQGSKKKVVAPNGKVLIVDSVGNVYLEETTEEGETREFLLDPNEIPKPTIYQTALFRLPIFFYRQSVGRFLGNTSANLEEPLLDYDGQAALQSVTGSSDNEIIATATAQNVNGETRKRTAKARS